jgi:NitT/TauT family transport system ATP-binding protein
MSEAPGATPLVTIARVAKNFRNGVTALAGVDLTVTAGSFLSILGPSGCGKSTLLRLIAGLSEPSSGTMEWHAQAKGRVGFVFQEPTLMPWATVWDNTYLPLRLLGLGKAAAAERIDATLKGVGLDGFSQVYPRELSGGMKMRVSIARALVTEPRLLLLDEPFAALDEITRFRLNEDLLRLWQRHDWTVVFVTHSVFESVFLSNRIVVMGKRPGRITADVPIELPYPREASLRTTPQYSNACAHLSQLLAEASA